MSKTMEQAVEGGEHKVGRVGMMTLIVTESCLLATFLVVYLFYIGKNQSGPTPEEVLHLPIFASIVLLSSSIVVHMAVKALGEGKMVVFKILWAITLVQGVVFLFCTGMEWSVLINEHGLTPSTNVFGSTFYVLVGAHAFHVVVGVLLLAIVLLLSLRGKVLPAHEERVDLVSWYWHFVDVVWVFVFLVVYVVGR